MTDNSWIMRQRRRLARWLMQFAGNEPAGGWNIDGQTSIDDGLDYLLPIVAPEWWPADKRSEAVIASMREHGFTDAQIEAAIEKRRNAFDAAVEQHRLFIEKETDQDKRARLQEASAPFMDQFSAPNVWERNIPAWPVADPLREWDSAGPLGTTSTRREILTRTHLAFERNPIAKRAVKTITLFSMGEGLTVKYYNPDVEKILEEFRCDPENSVETYEKSFLDALLIDGELFIRFYNDRNGKTLINPLKPWEMWWIESERGFPRRPVSYHWYSLQTNFTPGDLRIVIEDIPADEVMHIAINRLPYEQRGRPELFSILAWLKGYKDWLENRARQNYWRGALLWWVKLLNGTPGQVSSKRGQYKQPPPPGSIVVTNDKEEWSAISNDVKAGDASEDGRQIKMMSAIGMGIPEYMLSDGQNANLASASAQQLPALRTFAEFQDIAVNQIWIPIYKRVLQSAIDAGLLPEEVKEFDADGDATGETIKTLDAFDVEAPELESDDPQQLAQALQIAVNNNWASNETASGRMGFDYNSEAKKIEREGKQAMERAYQGAGAVPRIPGVPLANQMPAQPPEQEQEQKPKQESVRESVITQPVINVTVPQ